MWITLSVVDLKLWPLDEVSSSAWIWFVVELTPLVITFWRTFTEWGFWISRARQTFAGSNRSYFSPVNLTLTSSLDEARTQSQPQPILEMSNPMRMFNQCMQSLQISIIFRSRYWFPPRVPFLFDSLLYFITSVSFFPFFKLLWLVCWCSFGGSGSI